MKKKRQNAVLLLVGNGELKKNIEDRAKALGIADSIIFAGIRSDVPDLLSAMDIFVFPSFYEGMPNTVIEAQATGLPCVISNRITKEVKITDLVIFSDLKYGSERWADIINNNIKKTNRIDYNKQLECTGYNINKTVERFVKIIFGEEE